MTKIQIEEAECFVKPWGHYVYVHFRKSNLNPFYVGKGSGLRYKTVRGKTDWWLNCAKKHGVYVSILQCFDTKEEAFMLEEWIIAKMRHEGENLVNITNGGAGKPRGKCRKVNYGIRYNSVTTYCSNGMSFSSSEDAARWCKKNGWETARGSKISTVCDLGGRSVYGYAWSRIQIPSHPEFTGRDATNIGISRKKSKKVY